MAEVKCWTVGVCEIRPFAIGKLRKAQKEAMQYIVKTNGFIGVHPVPGRGTLLIYATENDAKRARNDLMARGCPCADNVCEIFVDEKYLPKGGTK